jgi:trehalose 6-phosphate phosphatase
LIGCDFDGTLAPIVADPALARGLPDAVDSLVALAAMPSTQVAVLSGRGRAELARFLGPTHPGLILIGSHGGEWETGFEEGLTSQQAELRQRLIDELRPIVSGVPGAFLEEKPGSVAVHVRQADRSDAARVLARVAQGPARLPAVAVINGKEVVELAVTQSTKGIAIDRLKDSFHPTATIYLGDDTTDEDAFAVLKAGDVGVKVGPGESAATARVAEPADVATVLAAIARLRASAVGSADGQLRPDRLAGPI